MFKKMFKNLGANLEEKAQDMAKNLARGMAEGKENPTPHDEMLKAYANNDMQQAFEAGTASMGITTMNTAKEDPNDPNMQPVHGITIADYAAGASKIGEGCSKEQVCAALGVERPMWDEAEALWNSRMRSDTTYNVVNVYSSYFGKASSHEKLGGLKPANAPATTIPTGEAAAHLERLETDKHYFFEIQAAQEAAYANGVDGAQWLIDNLGLTVSQVNGAGVKYMNDFSTMAEMMDFQEKKKAEYSERFAKENKTGGIVDDIDF